VFFNLAGSAGSVIKKGVCHCFHNWLQSSSFVGGYLDDIVQKGASDSTARFASQCF
jgi:hypothetical protein